jgi:hypothetical protein
MHAISVCKQNTQKKHTKCEKAGRNWCYIDTHSRLPQKGTNGGKEGWVKAKIFNPLHNKNREIY